MYWADRKKRLDAEMVKHEKMLFSRMQKYYRQQAAVLEREIAAYYGKYGTNNVIEYRKLLAALPDGDRALLMQRMEDFAAQYPQYAYLLPVRESIYKLNRLEGLRQSIAVQQLEMGAYEQKQAKKLFEQMAQRSRWAMGRAFTALTMIWQGSQRATSGVTERIFPSVSGTTGGSLPKRCKRMR